jgi:hypothetical protein
LAVSLVNIVLIDANSVDPDLVDAEKPKAVQSSSQVLPDGNRHPVNGNGLPLF